MKILIIEDQIKTSHYLAKGLRAHAFIVDVAHTGEEGLHQVLHQAYDLVILDVMLPKLDGWSVMREIHLKSPQTRVLFLTARNEVDDRVKGLELGAEDYLVKPFAFSEVLARVRTILRRSTSKKVDTLLLADLKIDLLKHKVQRSDVKIDLTAKEFALLVYLVEHQGEVLSRTLLAEQVWDINFDSDTNVIDVAIRRLRQKIDDPFEKKLIHTIRGVGYVLEAR